MKSIKLLFVFTWIISSGSVLSGSILNKINHMGCYDLGYSLRKNFHNHMAQITMESCVNLCCKKNTKYAGIEQSDNFCYCGGDIAEESIKRNDSLCNVRCKDQANKFCGGEWLMSLYDVSGACGHHGCIQNSKIGQVQFLVATSIGVRLYQNECSKDFEVLHTTNDWTYTVDYHFEKNLMYFLVNKRLYRTTFQPVSSTSNDSSPIPINNMTNCDGFAVDWVFDRIYWPDCMKNAIMSMDLNGTGVTTILNRPEEQGIIKRMEVDPYKRMLFWTVDGVIESCQLGDGTNFRTNMSRPGATVRALTLDLAASRVYYVGVINGTASLFSMNYKGGDQREVFSMSEVMSVYGLSLLNGSVYWVNYASSKDVLYKTTLIDPEDNLQMLTSIDRAVWHMRVVHPSIQQRPNNIPMPTTMTTSVTTPNPCEDKICAHRCVVESPTTASCTCPDDQILDTDGITCIASPPHIDSTVPDPCATKNCAQYCLLENPTTATCQCPDDEQLAEDGINCIRHTQTSSSLSKQVAEKVSVQAICLGLLLVIAIVVISGLLVYLGDKYWTQLHMKFTGAPYTRKRDGVYEDESNYHASSVFNAMEDNVVLVS